MNKFNRRLLLIVCLSCSAFSFAGSRGNVYEENDTGLSHGALASLIDVISRTPDQACIAAQTLLLGVIVEQAVECSNNRCVDKLVDRLDHLANSLPPQLGAGLAGLCDDDSER